MILLFLVACGVSAPVQDVPPAVAHAVGSEACVACHPSEGDRWRSSTHARAMLPAAVGLAGVPEGAVTVDGTRTVIRQQEGQVLVEVEEGVTRKQHRAVFTLGVEPLVQLLVERPGGRLQALGVAWDSRPVDVGGQRWFALHDKEAFRPGDPLHWDGPAQNANHTCLSCHTTRFDKGWDVERAVFVSTWSETAVGCEACHGPGSAHLAWAEGGRVGDVGLALDPSAGPGGWTFGSGPIASRSAPPRSEAIDTCAPCHVHGAPVEPALGRPIADTHRVSLLEPGLFHADGRVEGEVFEVGPFLRSKMYAAGVTCGDCHDPHGGGLWREGAAICTSCHTPSVFAVPSHSHHAEVGCVDCHMPRATFMAVDVRHDHGFGIPRPDRADTLGVPSACRDCHADRTEASLAEAAGAWWGAPVAGWPEALAAGRSGAADAEARLGSVLADASVPEIVRATAASLWPPSGSSEGPRRALGDTHPLVRRGAIEGLAATGPEVRLSLLAPSLRDPSRPVRHDAALALAGSAGSLKPEEREAFHAVADELRAWARVDGDRAEVLSTVCVFEALQGSLDRAEVMCRSAVARDPSSVVARVDLADVQRAMGDEVAAEATLRAGLASHDAPELHHALGLGLIRQGRREEGVAQLVAASDARPGDPVLAYAAAVGESDLGLGRAALTRLMRVDASQPWDADTLRWMRDLAREAGDARTERGLEARLKALE